MKKNKIRNKEQIIGMILCLFIITSCKKFVEVPLPGNFLENSEVFSTDNSATAAMAGLYTTMNSLETLFSGSTSLYPGLSADELINVAPSANAEPFVNNALTSVLTN
jgi:hypothetical protein